MKLWLLWVAATGVAFGVGGRLGVALSPAKDPIITGYIALSMALILAGVLQSLVLRRPIADAGSWALASVGAVAIIGVLVFGLGLINRDVGWVLGVIVGWIALGALQWLVLREQVPGAGGWMVANILGLIVAIPIVALTTWVSGAPDDTALGGFLRWLAFGAGSALATGSMMWWLLRERLESVMA